MKIDGNVIELRGAETSIDVDAPLRIKDGASFVDVRNYIAPVFQYENLVVKNNTGTPNSQIDVSWDSLYIGPIHSTTYTQTLNIESDTDWDSGDHTDEPANGFVYIHAFAKADGTEVCKFSLSATAPTPPTDYIYSRRISAPRNASGNFLAMHQINNFVIWDTLKTIKSTAGYYTNEIVDCSAYMPPMSKKIIIHAYVSSYHNSLVTSNVITLWGRIGGVDCQQGYNLNSAYPTVIAYAHVSSEIVTDSQTLKITTASNGDQSPNSYVNTYGYLIDL